MRSGRPFRPARLSHLSRFSRLSRRIAPAPLLLALLLLLTLPTGASGRDAADDKSPSSLSLHLPALGRDTVLIWSVTDPAVEKSFVARLASFGPDRYLEWEDENGQGTLLLTERDIQAAKGYDSSSLFVSGLEKRSKNATTLWLSRALFTELSAKKRAKLSLNGVAAKFTLTGRASVPVAVNGTAAELPVLVATDDRGGVWSFLDDADNPLLVRYEIRTHRQLLTSITTNQPDTLRWIKGRKLPAD